MSDRSSKFIQKQIDVARLKDVPRQLTFLTLTIVEKRNLTNRTVF